MTSTCCMCQKHSAEDSAPRKPAERERLAVTLASIGAGVIATDPEGRVVLLNKVAETYSGWTQQEAFGCRLATVLGQAGGEGEAVLATALAGGAAPEPGRQKHHGKCDRCGFLVVRLEGTGMDGRAAWR